MNPSPRLFFQSLGCFASGKLLLGLTMLPYRYSSQILFTIVIGMGIWLNGLS